MRYLIAFILALLLAPTPTTLAGDDLVDVSYTFRISMYGGGAHGCAVNGKTMTARHVVDVRNSILEPLPKARFRYDFFENANRSGVGEAAMVSPFSDLAVVKLDKEPPFGYADLGPEPKIGDRLRWVEYDFRRASKAYQPRGRSGKVVSVFAGLIVIEAEATKGASGGCAYNDANEVVGLISYKKETDDEKWVTGIAGLYGEWWAR